MITMPQNVSTLNFLQNRGQNSLGGAFNRLSHTYDDIISLENLIEAWKEFIRGKRSRKDAHIFQQNLMGNIISLHKELVCKTYQHSPYEAFNISDPKPRNIHKAAVRDRLLHHALYRKLYPFFDKTFIADSYSCRLNKGSHKALNRFRDFAYVEGENHTKTVWVLKCDIRKFFGSIDHSVLKEILKSHIPDEHIRWLLGRIIDSFQPIKDGMGLPLGNLTSQLLVNIYMNEFDQYVKHRLKAKYYIRYADDFLILNNNREHLAHMRDSVNEFLAEKLKLSLHPDKVFIKTLSSGIDFLGWVHFPHHRVLRTTTKRRMLKNMAHSPISETMASYLGMLEWGNACSLTKAILKG